MIRTYIEMDSKIVFTSCKTETSPGLEDCPLSRSEIQWSVLFPAPGNVPTIGVAQSCRGGLVRPVREPLPRLEPQDSPGENLLTGLGSGCQTDQSAAPGQTFSHGCIFCRKREGRGDKDFGDNLEES